MELLTQTLFNHRLKVNFSLIHTESETWKVSMLAFISKSFSGEKEKRYAG